MLRRLVMLLALMVPVVALADGESEPPEFVKLLPHGDIDVDPLWRHDATLQAKLDRVVRDANLTALVNARRCGIALVDVSDEMHPRLAEVQGGEMIYAASMPKIAVLYAAFQAQHEGRLKIDAPFHETLEQMCRVSCNAAASAAIQRVGFNYIASVMLQSGLYDEEMGGGLWVGKAYGGENDQWQRDPVANMSHGATAVSVARLLTLLSQERLVDAASSRDMLSILGNPGLHHKFVRGLDSRPSTIYRKSGSWREWHGDAALVERGGKRYVAVALLQSTDGERILEDLILRLDDCIPDHSPVAHAEMTPAPIRAGGL